MMDCQVFLCPGKELPVGISSPHFCLWLLHLCSGQTFPLITLCIFVTGPLAAIDASASAYCSIHAPRAWPLRGHLSSAQHTHTSHRGRTLGTTAAPERCMRKKQGVFVRQESGTGPLPITAEVVRQPVLLSSQLSSPLSIGGTITAPYNISESRH